MREIGQRSAQAKTKKAFERTSFQISYPMERGNCVSWLDATMNRANSRKYPRRKRSCAISRDALGRFSYLFPEVMHRAYSLPNPNGEVSVIGLTKVEFSAKHKASMSSRVSVHLASCAHLQLIVGHDENFEILQVLDVFGHDGELVRGQIQFDERRP